MNASRSANLRTYAGDTSLPGGRVEDSDATFEEAAVSFDIYHLCLFKYHLSSATRSLRRGRLIQ